MKRLCSSVGRAGRDPPIAAGSSPAIASPKMLERF
nr:MAG TPA: hypothetical protein [Caudoviricetes sp.]